MTCVEVRVSREGNTTSCHQQYRSHSVTTVQRMLEYTDLPREAATVEEGGGHPPSGWPTSSALVYHKVKI